MKKISAQGLMAGLLSYSLLASAGFVQAADPAPAAATTASAKADSLFADPVVVKGKGFEIKQSQINEAYIQFKANVVAQGGDIPEDQRASVLADLQDRLTITQLLLQRATDADKAAGKVAADKAIADMKKSLGTDEAFAMQVKAVGMTLDQFKARLLEQNICESVLEREVKPGLKVSDDAARKFYADNPAQFEHKEQVRAAHILVSTMDPTTRTALPPDKIKEKEKLAKDIKARVDKGEDFAKLVKEYSDDPGSKDKGGEYTFGKGEMAPEFEAAAFSLKVGQVSDLVQTRFGYHIIKTLEKIPAGKMEFDKIAPRLKEYLENQGMQRAMPPYIDKLKKEYNVEVMGKKAATAPEAKPEAK